MTVERRGQSIQGQCPIGSTVMQALESLEVDYSTEDIISPALYEVLSENSVIKIVAVTSDESKSQRIVPFISQTIRNETLPEGETYIIQNGQNGLEEITTKSTYEDGFLVSQTVSDRILVKESIPEILMLGVKAGHAPIQIPGKILFTSNGSIWLMQNTTGDRIPLVTSGDIDGRILDLSSNGEWLLFSRVTKDDSINSLWMLHITDWNAEPISLRISDVIHFAAWLPGETLRILYSSVTPQDSAPGWKANNDLKLQVVSDTGMIMAQETLVETNEEGIYSWWGTEFSLSSDGKILAYANPGSIGLIDRLTGKKTRLITILPYEKTRSDWAWIPGMSWSADGASLVYSFHGDMSGVVQSFDPSDFNLGISNIDLSAQSEIRFETGLFSYPSVSPVFDDGNSYIAFLEAITPSESESSRYRIMIMNMDGSDSKVVFPLEGGGYVSPQKIFWAPVNLQNEAWISFIYQGNIWLVNPFTGIYNQITIDQSITDFIWE
ncbi:MAG: G5 domain-containing protein [Flexilinea sp.]